MVLSLGQDFRALLNPRAAFREPPPSLSGAFGRMVLVWMPLAFLQALGILWQVLQGYGALRRGGTLVALGARLGLDPEGLRDFLGALPSPPGFGQLWPWLLVLVPLGVMGAWLHHAVWDHVGLWLLRGVRREGGFRLSLLAEAEALRVTALGNLAGLLSFLPWVGALVALPMMLLDAYLWLFRGVALAARHGCPLWKGVAATILHAALLGVCGLGLLMLMVSMLGLHP
jgi:hypothetical protein